MAMFCIIESINQMKNFVVKNEITLNEIFCDTCADTLTK